MITFLYAPLLKHTSPAFLYNTKQFTQLKHTGTYAIYIYIYIYIMIHKSSHMIDDVQYMIVFMLLFNNTSILPVYPSFVMPRASSPAERPGTRASAIEWYPPHAGPSSHGPSDHSTASDVALCCTWGAGIDHEKWRFQKLRWFKTQTLFLWGLTYINKRYFHAHQGTNVLIHCYITYVSMPVLPETISLRGNI